MENIQAVTGVTSVYPSGETEGFQDSEHYPIAWEFMFVNDEAGRTFTARLEAVLARFPKEKGYMLDLDGKDSDAARSVECVFRDRDSFRQLLHETMGDMTIFDEQRQAVVPKQALIDTARNLARHSAMAAAL